MYVPGKPFQPSLMYADKAGAYLTKVHLKLSTVWLVTVLTCKH